MEKEIIKEKAYLVCPYINMEDVEYRSKELELLAESALLDVVKSNIFHLKEINARTYMGIGKVQEIAEDVKNLGADIVIFDCPLTGSQLRNLGEEIDANVIDRTMLILDIFAGRAKSSEGKLQVELAQLKYMLPRLGILNQNSQRVGAGAAPGVGMRGPGETKFELDRRKIQNDILRHEKEIKEVQKHRQNIRKQRLNKMNNVALIGYTNAGKSTLMNQISKAGTYADDRLFATLDVLSKKVWDDGVEYILIDTVGFVSNLPHELMYAFSSTLEETLDADVLLIVVDASDKHKYEQIEVVENELSRLNCDVSKVILVYNKTDKLSDEEIDKLQDHPYDICHVAAKSGKNIVLLKQMIKEKLKHAIKKY